MNWEKTLVFPDRPRNPDALPKGGNLTLVIHRPAATHPMASPTALIIEDDSTLLRGLKDNFQAHEYSVVTAADGRQGLDAALRHSPDLVILDIMLPKINGYEVCRLIRQYD